MDARGNNLAAAGQSFGASIEVTYLCGGLIFFFLLVAHSFLFLTQLVAHPMELNLKIQFAVVLVEEESFTKREQNDVRLISLSPHLMSPSDSIRSKIASTYLPVCVANVVNF